MTACSPFGPAGEFAASRHGVLTRSQAADKGLTHHVVRRLVRDGHLSEPVPGVLVVAGSPPSWLQRLEVATLASKAAGVAGTRASAGLFGMDDYGPGPLELLVPNPRRIALPGLVQHRGPMSASDLTVVEGIRTTNIARTLCDLGNVDPIERVNLAFEWAWRRGVSLRWIEQTAQRLDVPNRSGPRMVLELIARARDHRVPTASVLEIEVERVIDSLPGVVRQYEVRRADGSLVGRVDFAIPALKIAIEGHSRRFHFGVAPENSDADREEEMHAEGWIVRFITKAQARRPVELGASLRALVAARLEVLGRSA
jgi:very-short-patch-repair endonuclease